MENKVDRSTAIVEINKWFDIIEYDESKIVDEKENSEQSQSNIVNEMLIKEVMNGTIVFDEDYQLIVALKTPIKNKQGEVLHDKLIFKTSVAIYEYNNAVKGIKADDADKRMLATIEAFTNVSKSRIDRLSTKSYRILQAIAGYLS